MDTTKAQELINKFRNGDLSAEEEAVLDGWYLDLPDEELTTISDEQLQQKKQAILRRLNGHNARRIIKPGVFYHRMLRIAAAVTAIFLGVWLYRDYKRSDTIPSRIGMETHDIAPGKNTATLTMTSGEVINLSDTKTGVKIDASKLTYSDGTVLLPTGTDLKNKVSSKVGMASVSTPRGGTYHVILPDGSKVWLNAASTIRFPLSFGKDADRRVVLSGEGFFEVAKNAERPFFVKTELQEVEVLGTHFNVSAYGDERSIKTTLLEGSVAVKSISNKGKTATLVPGQQSESTGTAFKIHKNVDVEGVVAWKNGYFRFNESLESIMNKISRWYNVEIIYEANPGAEMAFEGKISRNKTLKALLKNIEAAGSGFHFKIEGRRITVVK